MYFLRAMARVQRAIVQITRLHRVNLFVMPTPRTLQPAFEGVEPYRLVCEFSDMSSLSFVTFYKVACTSSSDWQSGQWPASSGPSSYSMVYGYPRDVVEGSRVFGANEGGGILLSAGALIS